MKRLHRSILLGIVPSLALSCGASSDSATEHVRNSNERIAGADPFVDRLDQLDDGLWAVSHGWKNGPYTVNDWRRENVKIDRGIELTLSARADDPTVFSSGEIQSHDTYGHGYFETSMQAARGSGIITGFFTYTGPPFGKPWNEIDIEILGSQPTKLAATYFRGDQKVSSMIELGFDASRGTHHYAFDWQPGWIRWFVDGQLVHEAMGDDLPLPNTQQKIMLHLWGTELLHEWAGRFNHHALPATARFHCIAYSSQRPARAACL